MKYISVFVLTLISLLVVHTGCNSASTAAPAGEQTDSTIKPQEDNTLTPVVVDTTKYTTLEWEDSAFFDAGTIVRGASPTLKFKFKNTGDVPLIINGVHASCNCTVPDTSINGSSILPGKSGIIRAVFHSKYQPVATHVKNIFVDANTKPHTGHILTFRAEVVEK